MNLVALNECLRLLRCRVDGMENELSQLKEELLQLEELLADGTVDLAIEDENEVMVINESDSRPAEPTELPCQVVELDHHKPTDVLPEQETAPIVHDLAKSMSLNDRFLFLRSLFHNDHEAMNRCLDELNACLSFKAASDYLANHYNWDEEQEGVKEFYALLEQVFN